MCRADTARGLTQLLEQVGSTPAPAPHIHWALLKFAAAAIILQAQTTPENLTWTPATVVENRHVGLSVKCPARWCKYSVGLTAMLPPAHAGKHLLMAACAPCC